jgi:CitMHS family citrate-Mg2+:H+ or citrate-Ca2+:H+ symporter
MLAWLGAGAIFVLLAAILLNRCSPLVALIVVPVAAALIGGFGLETASFIVDGVTKIAPMAAMFVFAILFFGVMTDAGLMDPIIARVLRVVGENPARVVVGSALLALLVHLDGSGAVCFLVVIPAMLPLYDRLGLDRRVLACVVSMAAGVNFLPWTGPRVRSAAALDIPVSEIFRPLIPVQAVGLAFVFGAAWWLGKREERRIAGAGVAVSAAVAATPIVPTASTVDASLRRPHLFWVNLLLTLLVMAALIAGFGPPAAVFMTGAALALLINYPKADQQRQRVEAHARTALMMAAILLAAGAFTGILSGMGALQALAQAAVRVVPEEAGQHIPFALSLIAMPLSMVFDPDSFYFGVMPVVAKTYEQLGGQPIQVAQAALVGQMTAGFPVSPLTPATFLVAGLTRLDLSVHQRFTFPFLYAASLCMAIACVVFGVFPA